MEGSIKRCSIHRELKSELLYFLFEYDFLKEIDYIHPVGCGRVLQNTLNAILNVILIMVWKLNLLTISIILTLKRIKVKKGITK